MFDDVERIEWLDYYDYKRAVYYLNHPDEYPGDFVVFREKLLDYAERIDKGKVRYLGIIDYDKNTDP